MPGNRAEFSGAINNGYIYAIGGWDGAAINSTIYYASLSRIQVGGSLDLVGLSSGNLSTAGEQGAGSLGGSITAGNILGVGSLQIQGTGSFAQGVAINGNLTVAGSASIGNATAGTAGTFPSTSILDNFNRANGSAGPNWQTIDPTYEVPSVSSNQFVQNSTSKWPDGYWTTQFPANQEVYIKIGDYNDQAVLMARLSNVPSTTENGYEARFNGSTVLINKVVGAVRTQIASGTMTGTQFWVGLRVFGSTITAYVSSDGSTYTAAATATDTTYTGAGYIGFFQNDSSASIHSYDDFGGGGMPITGSNQTVVAGSITGTSSLLLQSGTGNITLSSTSSTLVKPVIDSTTAFQVQNSTGGQLLTADTANMRVSIGSGGTAAGQLYVSGLLPAAAGWVATGSTPGLGSVAGNLAFVANNGGSSFSIIDTSNPSSLSVISTVTTSATPADVQVQGHYAYVATNGTSFQVFDISNPRSVGSAVGSATIDTGGNNLYVQGRYAYVSTTNGLAVVDISNPSSPRQVGGYTAGLAQDAVFVQGRYAYLTGNDGKLHIVDISNPANPVAANGAGASLGASASGHSVYVQGRYAYAVDRANSKLVVFDVSDPTTTAAAVATVGSSISTPEWVTVQGHYAYITNNNTGTAAVYDISAPASPALVGTINTGAGPWGEMVSGRYLYVINDSAATLWAFDLGGTYTQQLEAGSAEVGTLQVDSNAQLAGDVNIQGGVNIGQGLQVGGNVGVLGNIQTTGDLGVGSRYGNRLFSDNFESGNFNLWTGGATGAQTTIDTTTVHGGKYSAKVAAAGSVNYLLTNISSGSSTEYVRFWTYVSSASNDATLAVFQNPAETGGANGAMIASVFRQNTTGYFCLYNQYSAISSCSTTAITTGAWHLIEFEMVVNGASGSFAGWLDGTQLVNASSQNLGTVNGSQLLLGEPFTARTETTNFDDVSVDTASNGTASSLNVDDSFHVGGGASFGSNVAISTQGVGTTPLSIDDASTGINLLTVQDMSQNFGGLISSGAFISNLSGGRQDFNASKAGVTTAGSTGGFGDDGKWYVNNSATSVTTGLTTSNPNGYIRIAPGTTSGTGGEVAFGAAAGTLDKLFTPNNDLPVVQMKVRPSTMVATDDFVWGMMDQATAPTANDTLPANGIFFWSNNGTGTTGWLGVVRLASANIGTVTCPGSATANKWATGRISVLKSDASHTYVDFMIDNDASDGVNMLDCGTVTTSSLWTAGTTLGYGMYDVHTSVTGGNTFDMDYALWWQDDNSPVGTSAGSVPAAPAAAPAPLIEDNVPQTTTAQTGLIDFTTATSEDVTFNGSVYVHGTLYADKIVANQIEGLSIFTDQLDSLQAQLNAVKSASTTNISGSGSTSSGAAESSDASNGALTLNLGASGLTVGGDAAFNGNVFFYKLVTFVQKAVFNEDVSFGGHITTAGATPTVSLETAAGITVAPPPDPINPAAPPPNLAKDTISGNDNSGSLSVTFGDNAAAGEILTVKFAKPYGGNPSVFLTPANQAAAGLKYYITSAQNGFTIVVTDPPLSGTTLNFNYLVIQ